MPTSRWQLDGQLALVTGASAGIGRAIAHELLGLGARVRIAARGADLLEDAREELLDAFPSGDVRALACDMADDEQRRQVLDWVEDEGEGLHILINNAGGNLTRAVQDYTEDEWREIFEINLFSAFELSRHAYPLLAVYAKRFSGMRCALLGDAAVGMHPVTAHGFNLGLAGVARLAYTLVQARARNPQADLGAPTLLAAYARDQHRHAWPLYRGTNTIVRLFTDARPVSRLLRQTVLAGAQRLPPLKAAIVAQLTGRLARPAPQA